MRRSWLIVAALVMTALICGEYFGSFLYGSIVGSSAYPRIEVGPFSLPSYFNNAPLLWPFGAALFSLIGLFKPRCFRTLGLLLGLTFSLFMTALFVHQYTWSLEYDPNRMGGMIQTTLMWMGLFTVNVFASWAAIKQKLKP